MVSPTDFCSKGPQRQPARVSVATSGASLALASAGKAADLVQQDAGNGEQRGRLAFGRLRVFKPSSARQAQGTGHEWLAGPDESEQFQHIEQRFAAGARNRPPTKAACATSASPD